MPQHEQNEKFIFLMAGLSEAFGQEATEMKIKIYAKALEDLTLEQIEQAAWNIIKTRTTATFPKPAELREAISGKAEDMAVLAVGLIDKAWANGLDSGCNVNFHDSILHECISAQGGWIELCFCDDWKFRRKDMIKHYTALRNSGKMPSADTDCFWGEHGGYDNRTMLESIGRPVKVYHLGMKQELKCIIHTTEIMPKPLPIVELTKQI